MSVSFSKNKFNYELDPLVLLHAKLHLMKNTTLTRELPPNCNDGIHDMGITKKITKLVIRWASSSR